VLPHNDSGWERWADGRTGTGPSSQVASVQLCVRQNAFNFVKSYETGSWVQKSKKALNKFMKNIPIMLVYLQYRLEVQQNKVFEKK
jgi:hypothetical protein